jgi:hypothetical protein
MGELTFSLAGACGVLRSECAPLMSYAERHLQPLRLTPMRGVPVIEATLAWHESAPPADRRAGDPVLGAMDRVDRDLYVGPGRIDWFRIDDFRDLHLRVQWDGACLRVHGDYYFYLSRDPLRDRARRWLTGRQADAQRARRFTTLLYYLVYYPAFWWYETLHGFHPIHAAGVVSDAGAILLAGASGVGKSTLALALAASGGSLLSETFVLHRGTAILPVREPLLLDAASRAWLGDSMHGLEPVREGFVFARDGFHCVSGLADEGEAAVVVLPHRAPATAVRALTGGEAHQRISASDQLVKDVRRYWAFAAALEPLARRGLMARREESLAKLTANTRCFEFAIGPDLGREQAVRMVTELAESGDASRPLRAQR